MNYNQLKKLWNQNAVYTWNLLENNIWLDYQLSRAEVEFSGVLDNRKEGDLILNSATINFNSRANVIVSGKDYFGIFNDFYPDYYRNDPLKVAWLKSLDVYFNQLDFSFEYIKSQFFIDTCISHLYLFEKEYGIVTDESLDFVTRRNRILAKAFINQPFKKKNLQVVLDFLGLSDLEIVEEINNYYIYFAPETVNLESINLLQKIVNIWKPAHVNLGIMVSNTIWESLEPYKWKDLETYNWSW